MTFLPDLALVAVALCAFGFLPALAITKSVPRALFGAPIVAALLAWTSTLIAIEAGLSTAGFRGTFTWANLLAIAVLAATKRPDLSTLFRGSPGSWRFGIVGLIGSLIPALTLRRAPFLQDPRSIWFFQAEWISRGARSTIEAMQNPAYTFAHFNYPKLVPATTAAVWNVLGSKTDELGQATTGILVLSAAATFALVVGTMLVDRSKWLRERPDLMGIGVGLLVLAVFGIGGRWPFTGNADFLWAVCVAAAVVLVLVDATDDVAFGAVLLAAVVSTKNEGMVTALVVVAAGLIRHRRDRRLVGFMLVPLMYAIGWVVVFRHVGVPPAYSSEALAGVFSSEAFGRIGLASESIWLEARLQIVGGLLVGILGWRLLKPHRRALSLGSSWNLWLPATASFLGLGTALILSSALDRYGPVAARVTLAGRVLLLTEIAISGFMALDMWGTGRSQSPQTGDAERPG